MKTRVSISLAMCLALLATIRTVAQSPQDVQQARRLRADAAYLEMLGELEAARARYEESLQFLNDPAVVEKVEALQRAIAEPPRADPAPTPEPADTPAQEPPDKPEAATPPETGMDPGTGPALHGEIESPVKPPPTAPEAGEPAPVAALPPIITRADGTRNWTWPPAMPEVFDFEVPEGVFQRDDARATPDLRQIAWIERDSDRGARVVLNGVPGNWYEDIRPHSMQFSPGGESFRFIAKADDKEVPIINGVEHTPVDDVDRIFFSDNGSQVVVVARHRPDQNRVFLNGALVRETGIRVNRPVVANHGVAAWIETGADSRIVTSDGTEGPPYQAIYEVRFVGSPAHLFYLAQKDDEERYLVRDEQVLMPTMGFTSGFAVSPDGVRTAYSTPCEGGGFCMVVDGQKGERFQSLDSGHQFSPDGARHAYVARDEEHRAMLIVDGIRVEDSFESLWAIRPIRFSPDARQWAAAFQISRQEYALLVNGREIARRPGQVRQIIFSPDGSRVAWLEEARDGWYALLDGQEDPLCKQIYDGDPPWFSDDGQHLLYLHRDGDRMFLTRFGSGTSREHEGIAPMVVPTPEGARYMAIDGSRVRILLFPWSGD